MKWVSVSLPIEEGGKQAGRLSFCLAAWREVLLIPDVPPQDLLIPDVPPQDADANVALALACLPRGHPGEYRMITPVWQYSSKVHEIWLLLLLFNILGYLMLLHVKANKNNKAKAVMLTNVLATS